MAKKVKSYIKSQIDAGKANPAGLGSTLGPAGINIMEFCKAFNAYTQSLEEGTPIPVTITVFEDRSFSFITKSPPVTYYIKKAVALQKGSATTGKVIVGKIKNSQIRKIAEDKLVDLNTNNIDSAMLMIRGSAVSMGLEVVED